MRRRLFKRTSDGSIDCRVLQSQLLVGVLKGMTACRKLPNCFLAPDVWDFKKAEGFRLLAVAATFSLQVSGLAAAGNLCDVLLLLSVARHRAL